MSERYELRAVFKVTDSATLIRYARRRHRAYYPPGTPDAAPRPNDVATALVDSLIDCREGPALEELGLEYLESVSGPIDEREQSVVDAVRSLHHRTGGQGPFWDALTKLLDATLTATSQPAKRGSPRNTLR